MRAARLAIAESEFRAQVLQLATRSGWLVYPAPDVPGSLVLCRPPVLLFVGLKTETGKLRHEQREWLEALRASESARRVVAWDAIRFLDLIEE